MTNDLISREKLIDWFRPYGQNDEHIPFEELVVYTRDDAPAVDAVEVVRCSECEFKSTKGCAEDTIVCDKLGNFYSVNHACNEGKRRESENTP